MSNERILKACGFFELPKGELRVSTDLREAFSREVIHDHDTRWLNQHLADRPPAKEFWFYFNVSPENADQMCREILVEIGLPALLPRPASSFVGLGRKIPERFREALPSIS